MKIAHIFWSFTVGGAETMVVDIANQQVKDSEVSLFIINSCVSLELLSSLDPEINVILLNRTVSSKNLLPFLRLNFLLFRGAFNVIHCHNFNLEKIISGYLLKKAIVTIHGFNRPIGIKNKYFKVVAISKAIEKDLLAKGLRNVETIFNGVDTVRIDKKSSFNENLKVVCIGRLNHAVKGQDILINAFSLLKKDNFKAKLFFIGDGPSRSHLMGLVNELKLTEDVVFCGGKTRSELYTTIRDFDVLIQPSIHEGFGLTVVEAMAAQVPVIVSEASGLMEVTSYGKYAGVISPNTPGAIAKKVVAISERLYSTSMRVKLLEASAFVNCNYSIKTTCSNYHRLYLLCLESQSSRRAS